MNSFIVFIKNTNNLCFSVALNYIRTFDVVFTCREVLEKKYQKFTTKSSSEANCDLKEQ